MASATTPQGTLDPPSLFDEVSAGLLDEYQPPRVLLPAGRHFTPPEYMITSQQVSPLPSSESSVSNSSDDFVPTGKRGGRRIAQRKKKIVKRGAAREIDAIKKVDKEESVRKTQELENESARKAQELENEVRVERVKTRSGGTMQMEMEKIVDSDVMEAEKAVQNDETKIEKFVEGNETEMEKVVESDEMTNEGN
jgi:hypothetical protein